MADIDVDQPLRGPSQARLIDLTHPMRASDAVYPGDPPLQAHSHASINDVGYRLTRLVLGAHHGTHVDAPSHYLRQGATIEGLPLEKLIGRATVIDVPGQPGDVTDVEMLLPHQDSITEGGRVLFRTGWESRYPGGEFFENYPGLSLEAARWLTARRVALVGFDTPGPSQQAQAVHEELLREGAETIIVESLANLSRLPSTFQLIVLPLALAGVEAAPARAVAILDR